MTKLLSSLTTVLLDQCSYSTGQSQCWYQKKQGIREETLIPTDKHTGKIKFPFGIQNFLLQKKKGKINPFLYKETLFTVIKIIFTIVFGLLVFEHHWPWPGKMFVSLSIPSAINCSLISLSLQDLRFPVNRMCIFTLRTMKKEQVVIISDSSRVFLIFKRLRACWVST